METIQLVQSDITKMQTDAIVQDFLKQDTTITQVVFVCFDDENYNIYESLLKI